MALNLKNIISAAVNCSISTGNAVLKQTKKKLLFVNVLYPPQTVGGATVLLKNIIDKLQETSGERYEISVFTYDLDDPKGYEISEYTYDGISVTKIGVPLADDVDWRYQDQIVYKIFYQYLTFHQPDLIHFHCVQRLTASTLEAADSLNIPYIVTAHDAWWICDQQFMLDDSGVEWDYRQNDPLIINRYAKDVNLSIQRRRYLAQYLNKAKAVLAVSEFQAQLYRLNGFHQVQVNRNGVIPAVTLPRKLTDDNKIRLGYAGGICVHKGYYFLREAIMSAGLENSELKVIDVFMAPDTQRNEKWGSTKVTFIPRLSAEKMSEFFSNIDVLVAPSLWPEVLVD
ncbi:MAG: glycosyltransferase family 4 protein [Calothrix sp. SM1_7_51]|nr:glycosyltransferase family 4 protein [Calothrix sp. SM1_7_51]